MEGNVAEESAWRGCVGCGVWKVWKEGRNVEEEGEDGGRLGRVGKSEERYTAFIPNKPLPIAWPAAIIPTTFRHSPPLSNSNTCLQPSPCDTLHTTCYALHFTHYTLHSTLHTLHCFAWPHSNLFSFFHCFSDVLTLAPTMPSMDTLHYSLYTLRPPPGINTHLQPSPCRLLCLASPQSFLVLPLLFLCFDPRPQCTSMDEPGGFTLYDPYLTLPCLAQLQSFLVLPLLFLCFDPRPQCTSMDTPHLTLYSPYSTLHCFA